MKINFLAKKNKMQITFLVEKDQWEDLSSTSLNRPMSFPDLLKDGTKTTLLPTARISIHNIRFLDNPEKSMTPIEGEIKSKYLCKGEVIGAQALFSEAYIVIDCGIEIRVMLYGNDLSKEKVICFRKGDYIDAELIIEGQFCDSWEGRITNNLTGRIIKTEKVNDYIDVHLTLEVTKVENFTYDDHYTNAKGVQTLGKCPEVCIELKNLQRTPDWYFVWLKRVTGK